MFRNNIKIKVSFCYCGIDINWMAATKKQEPVEPGDASWIGAGHREVVCP